MAVAFGKEGPQEDGGTLGSGRLAGWRVLDGEPTVGQRLPFLEGR